MRRLRRDSKWSLSKLAEKTGLNYPHLSRMENDSTVPRADTVAKLAESLGGDLKVMLELADCLPRTILDRIMSTQEDDTADSLKRTAGNRPSPGDQGAIIESFQTALTQVIAQDETGSLVQALDELVHLEEHQRNAVINLIHSLASGGEYGNG